MEDVPRLPLLSETKDQDRSAFSPSYESGEELNNEGFKDKVEYKDGGASKQA